MDNEAHKIARHHLGDTLTSLMRGGPTAGDWIVFACHDQTEVSARAATVAEAAADCAAQLRAAGWVPTHPRLEWGDNRLYLYTGKTRFVVATYLLPACDVLIHPDFSEWRRCYSQAAMVATIAEWCAANLPNYHLPPFPGASQ
jgi:hypothetical protein